MNVLFETSLSGKNHKKVVWQIIEQIPYEEFIKQMKVLTDSVKNPYDIPTKEFPEWTTIKFRNISNESLADKERNFFKAHKDKITKDVYAKWVEQEPLKPFDILKEIK